MRFFSCQPFFITHHINQIIRIMIHLKHHIKNVCGPIGHGFNDQNQTASRHPLSLSAIRHKCRFWIFSVINILSVIISKSNNIRASSISEEYASNSFGVIFSRYLLPALAGSSHSININQICNSFIHLHQIFYLDFVIRLKALIVQNEHYSYYIILRFDLQQLLPEINLLR